MTELLETSSSLSPILELSFGAYLNPEVPEFVLGTNAFDGLKKSF